MTRTFGKSALKQQMQAEMDQLRVDLGRCRINAIEECARLVERHWYASDYGPEIAAAIRALKDKPCR